MGNSGRMNNSHCGGNPFHWTQVLWKSGWWWNIYNCWADWIQDYLLYGLDIYAENTQEKIFVHMICICRCIKSNSHFILPLNCDDCATRNCISYQQTYMCWQLVFTPIQVKNTKNHCAYVIGIGKSIKSDDYFWVMFI